MLAQTLFARFENVPILPMLCVFFDFPEISEIVETLRFSAPRPRQMYRKRQKCWHKHFLRDLKIYLFSQCFPTSARRQKSQKLTKFCPFWVPRFGGRLATSFLGERAHQCLHLLVCRPRLCASHFPGRQVSPVFPSAGLDGLAQACHQEHASCEVNDHLKM